ncbi:protein krueppel-like [Armigeres subalbatus]|uniref:protein krueppel-like n=1 Tax=Armigeres subalbatus TaxID=124917 RepID=UPI002ED312A0
MQSNLYSEDLLFNYWNEFDGGPANYPPPLQQPHQPPPPTMMGPQFDNGSFNFVPPPAGISMPPMPMVPMMPGPCPPNPMMGPIHRGYARYPPPLAALQVIQPPISQPQPPPPIVPSTHHFNFQPQPPPPQFPVAIPPVPVPLNLEPIVSRPAPNEAAPAEEVVVKNGQVFHISFLDDPVEPENSAPANPTPANEDADNDEERDWINYDELPLLKHVAGGETEEGVFKCGICTKELKSALNLYVHEQTHKTTRLDCKICGKRFNRIGKLEHHVRRHHPDSTPERNSSPNSASSTPVLSDFNHYCVDCEEFFGSREELGNHFEQNHRLIDDDGNGPKGLKKSIGCPYCDETFEWPCLLKTHMTKHTGEKPFICERCNVSFRFVQSFYRHNRRVHGREK